MSAAMVAKQGWTGSDLSARTEVVRYLRQHGGKIEDKSGLAVTHMRAALGKGRALSQLLADMDEDQMIRREIRGRRTFSIELLDDWGLVPKAVPKAAEDRRRPDTAVGTLDDLPTSQEGLEQLADALLAIVVKRASTPVQAPESAAEERRRRTEQRQLTERLTSAEKALAKAQDQLGNERAQRKDAEQRASELAETVRILNHNLEVLNAELTKPQKRQRGGGQGPSVFSRLGDEERATLATLMKQLPGDVRSREDDPKPRQRRKQTR